MTGASGYAGGAIAARLRTLGVRVITAGRASTNDLKMDLTDPGSVAALPLPAGIDACVHAAAMHEVGCRADPQAAYVVNVAGTRAVLQACARAGIRRLAYVSTFHVYGRPAGSLDETTLAVPGNDYGLTHLQAEQLFEWAARASGASVDILRPSNLYGVPASWHGFARWTLAPFDFCRQAVQADKIVLHGQGTAMRNYLDVAQFADLVARRLQGAGVGLSHVAGTDWRIRDLAMLAAQQAGEVLRRDVPVLFGDALESAAPAYQFHSRHPQPRGGDAPASMAAFLRATLTHLTEQTA
ncbi:NAD-dependent epimerase/dehydratase family protein [Achromobacter anxifer]|uniref:NAD-dependent epimerase/dehydratase family protein n=1 Tax=Achromobacter anxifer TaxID=1287737 RepID=UPI002157ED39|nr:SDR family oxidoreductase [Achromobacter anxifer]